MHNLAGMLITDDERIFEDALPMYEEILRVRLETLGELHVITFAAMDEVVGVLLKLRDRESRKKIPYRRPYFFVKSCGELGTFGLKAEQLLQDSLARRRKKLGNAHASTLANMERLVDLLHEQSMVWTVWKWRELSASNPSGIGMGRLAEARQLALEALDICTHNFPGDEGMMKRSIARLKRIDSSIRERSGIFHLLCMAAVGAVVFIVMTVSLNLTTAADLGSPAAASPPPITSFCPPPTSASSPATPPPPQNTTSVVDAMPRHAPVYEFWNKSAYVTKTSAAESIAFLFGVVVVLAAMWIYGIERGCAVLPRPPLEIAQQAADEIDNPA